MTINMWDVEELALRAMGKTEEEKDEFINENGDIEEAIFDEYGVDFDNYARIVEDLLPFTAQVQSGITGDLYHAFVDSVAQVTLVKIKAKAAGEAK